MSINKLSMYGHQASVNNDLPQGCVLRAMFFIMYTSALYEKWSNEVKISQYADDFLIVITRDSREEAEDILRQQACLFTNQCSRLKLPGSLETSHTTAFSRACTDVFRLNINSILLDPNKTITFL